MHLAAFSGIAIVLALGAVFYLGTDSLRGSLTDGGSTVVDVVITADGRFSPNSVEVHPGNELVITNENPDPQVLKPNGNSELFPVQVLFDEPYSFIIPAAALGKTYVYSSETLPEDELLEIRVVEESATPATSSASSQPEDIIPLPPPAASSSSSAEVSSSSSVSSSIPVVQASSAKSGQPVVVTLPSSSSPATPPVVVNRPTSTGTPNTFSLRPAATSDSSSSLPSLSGNGENIPANPYTVGNRSEAERLGLLKSSKSSSASLKSGADLRRVELPKATPVKVRTPKTNVETGPGPHMAIVTLLTMALMALYYRRVIGGSSAS